MSILETVSYIFLPAFGGFIISIIFAVATEIRKTKRKFILLTEENKALKNENSKLKLELKSVNESIELLKKRIMTLEKEKKLNNVLR